MLVYFVSTTIDLEYEVQRKEIYLLSQKVHPFISCALLPGT